MSLVPMDGVYRRRLFSTGRRGSRRATIALTTAFVGAGLFLVSNTPTLEIDNHWFMTFDRSAMPSKLDLAPPIPITPVVDRAASAIPSRDESARELVPAVPSDTTFGPAGPKEDPALVAEPTPEALSKTAAIELPVRTDGPATLAAPAEDTAADSAKERASASIATTVLPPPFADAILPASIPAPKMQKPLLRPFVELSYYSDSARAQQGKNALQRLWDHELAGVPLRIVSAEVRGKRIWRVVAGPLASRERGKKFCAVVHKSGRQCAVALI